VKNIEAHEIKASLTTKGAISIEKLTKQIDESLCFVAMWFDKEVKEVFSQAIQPACNNAGYDARKIDDEQFNNGIVDEIVAAIRRSKFIVADLTGDRGGVYYEAGFARGLGKEVILTCREDWFDNTDENKKVHFDVKHNNIIVWETLGMLKKELQNRIEATLGKGSFINKNELSN